MKQSRAWWQERSRVLLADCARLVTGRIGADAVEAVFLCGSLASRDESIVLETDQPILLSDVDLVVVLRSLAGLQAWAPRREELGRACEALAPEIRFSGRVDVGTMLVRDLERLPARPGVLDMRSRGVVLSGDPQVLDHIPAYGPADIEAREAVILMENRGVALLEVRPGASGGPYEPYGRLYAIARAYTDIAAAALSLAGSYVPGYAARRDRLLERVRTEPGGVLAALVGGELGERIDRWTAFKLEPTRGAAGGEGNAAVDDLWDRAARDVLRFWRQTAGGAGRGGWRAWRDHLRAWRPVLGAVPAPRAFALAASLGPRVFTRDPLAAVREEGMRILALRLEDGASRAVRGARGGFPHRGGAWEDAADATVAAWNGLVFGRKAARA